MNGAAPDRGPVLVAVVGPTATGKSDLGVALALALGGEVVNADAMQVYRGMDVGTAKLTVAERRGVAHHAVDLLDPREDATLAGYQEHALAAIEAITARGARPVVVGGSGLYVRGLLDEMTLQPTDPQVRAALERRAEVEGPGALHDELARRDPEAAARIGRRNTRRVVRALEVIELTGRPYGASLPEPRYRRPTLQIGLDCARAVLDERIAARVDRMWAQGLVDEARRLAGPALDGLGRTAARAVGYAEVLDHLRGGRTEDEARSAVVAATRRLARRQMSWFGRDTRVHWLDAQDPDLVERALALVREADAGLLPPPTGGRRTLGA